MDTRIHPVAGDAEVSDYALPLAATKGVIKYLVWTGTMETVGDPRRNLCSARRPYGLDQLRRAVRKELQTMSEKSLINSTFYARRTDDRTKPQPLCSHLVNVSRRARTFAESARRSDLAFTTAAKLAGLLHDLGKYRLAFQEYLNVADRGRRSAETDHAVYGAAAGCMVWDAFAVAFAIAGHHAGLHDQDQLRNLITGVRYRALDRFSELVSLADADGELAGALRTLMPSGEDASESLVRIVLERTMSPTSGDFTCFVRM